MEDIDGGLHPAVDGQSLDEDEDEVISGFLTFVLRTAFSTILRSQTRRQEGRGWGGAVGQIDTRIDTQTDQKVTNGHLVTSV